MGKLRELKELARLCGWKTDKHNGNIGQREIMIGNVFSLLLSLTKTIGAIF